MRYSLLCSSVCSVLLAASPCWGQAPSLAELAAQVSALQTTVAKLTRYIQVIEDAATSTYHGLSGPHIIFTGANVHIRSGSGWTHKGRTVNGAWVSEPLGLGNLIIGYNEANDSPTADTAQRGGSHNLVIGTQHQYPNSGGLVAGNNNVISGNAASVSGGLDNTASGLDSSVSGGWSNTASGYAASVSGGYRNRASNERSSVSGGLDNTASGASSSVNGGYRNRSSGWGTSVSGGFRNTATSTASSVSGGSNNQATGNFSTVGGGSGVTVIGANDFSNRLPACLTTKDVDGQAKADVVFEGCNVHIRNGDSSTNTTNGLGNLIVGYNEDLNTVGVRFPRTAGRNDRSGSHNVVIGPEHEYSSHSGLVVGVGNIISGAYASVSGGRDNEASGDYGSVSGGQNNEASDDAASVSGGVANVASGSYASVSGGQSNMATSTAASISGGTSNRVNGTAASVSGGYRNVAESASASVSGGQNNVARAPSASVSGGYNNVASGQASSVSGGQSNVASGISASVSGGQNNVASGQASSVSGGSGG